MDIKLTQSQQKAYDALKRGENVFITGGAGTGKTTIIKKYIEEIDPKCEHTLLTAPTGKAALNLTIGNVRGSTIHRTFGLKKEILPKFKGHIPDILSCADRIIIDEISMMRIDIFDYVASALIEEITGLRWIIGRKLQVILVGDFFQLPPVLKTKAESGDSDYDILRSKYGNAIGKGYCFQSELWNQLDIRTYELTEIMRQKDDQDFCAALNKIRIGDASGIDYINDNCDHSAFIPDRVTICGTNRQANRINEAMLAKNPNKKREYQWEINSKISYTSNYLKSMPCIDKLQLCVGARVICIANNPSAVNGQTGTVVSIRPDCVIVKWDNGTKNSVYEYIWEITRQEIVKDPDDPKDIHIESKTILEVSQLPLKLAYAITVHKSQGETLEAINIMTDLFETGHLYTALSRCPHVEMIRLQRPLRQSDVLHDKTINNFYFNNKGGKTL